MPNILVTGANGFIGQALCKRLMAEGLQVRGALRRSNRTAEMPTGVETVQIESIGPETDWSDALSNIDTVVHLAARVHVLKDHDSDPLALYRHVNVQGTKHLARMAVSKGVNRFIYMSSIKVNGEGRPTAYTEKDIPAPEDHYGLSKWEAEQILSKINAASEIDVAVFRAPLVYGPGVKANFLQLLKTVQKGIPLPLANVDNQRSLIYLENLVDVIIRNIKSSQPASGTYLVSDGEDVSTPELIRRIAAALGASSRLFPFSPSIIIGAAKLLGKKATVDRLLGTLTVDTTKIQRELDWKPPYTMEQGLGETAKWFRRDLSP
jgi:nucleoside-diphosphate-sugar epimerase